MKYIFAAIFFPFYLAAYAAANVLRLDARHDMPTPCEWIGDIKTGI